MTLAITHSTVVVVPDDGTSPVGTDEWNAAHTLTGTVSVAQGGTGTSTALTQGSVIFAGASGVYSQNNAKLNWNDSSAILLAGSQLNLLVNSVSVSAFYPIYNASGNNWFIAGSGNATVTGTLNLAMGESAVANLTTGNRNVAVGQAALIANTSGDDNVALGQSALHANLSGTSNVALGYQTLFTNTANSANVAIGNQALHGLNGADHNISIGSLSGYALTTGAQNIQLGSAFSTSRGPTTGSGNVIIGTDAGGTLAAGANNTILGGSAAQSLTGGSNSVYIGAYPGASNITGGSNNTLIGGWAGPVGTLSSAIALSDGAGNLRLDYNYTTANVFSFQRATSASTLHVYNTYSSAGANYERAIFDWQGTSNVLTIGTEALGTGTVRNLQFTIGGTNVLDYGIHNTGQWTFITAANLNSTFNMTTAGSAFGYYNNNGPTYYGTFGCTNNGATSTAMAIGRSATLGGAITNVIFGIVDTGVLSFGGMTSSFPGLVNSSAELRARLADDSGDANFRAKSVRGTAVTFANVPGTPVEGMLVAVTDSTTVVWGATITGGGANHVLAYYNGTNWTVAGK
jgi:hypothetical protein